MPRTARATGIGGVSHSDTEGMSSLYRTDTEGESLLPPVIRNRLCDLFGKIEREFEALYDENLQLRHQLEVMNDKLEQATGKKDRESLELLDVTKHSKKTEKPANQISQKLKNTYKSHTSRIVSSFRAPTPACQLKREFRGHRDGVWEVSVSKTDPHIIATACADQTSRVWWVQNSTCLLQYCGHNGSVNSIRFHPSQDLVLTASGDHTAHIWRAHVNKPLIVESTKTHSSEEELEGSERDESEGLDVDDKIEDTIVRQASMELTGHSAVIIAADWLTDGSQVITGSWDRTANLYDVETGEIVNTLTGHDQELTNVCAHSSQKLAVTASKDTTFRLWDLRDPSMKVNVFQGHTQPVTTAVFACSDKVVSGSDDRSCKVWDLKNMRSPITTIRTDSAVNRLSVHPLYNRIAIPQDNRHIRIYDINGERILRLPRSNRQGHSRMVCAATWSERESSVCNLYTCGFDRHVFGWNISVHSKD